MKKVFKTLSLSLLVAVFGVFCLVGCGADEFANAQKITSDELNTYIASEEVQTSFTGYKMTAETLGTKILDATVATGADEKLEAALVINMPASLTGSVAVSMSMYLKDGIVYADAGEGQKVKMPYDANDEDFAQLVEALRYAGDIKEMINESLSYPGVEMAIKKLEDGNKTKFLLEATQTVQGYTMVSSLRLVYTDNVLTEVTETQKVGNDVLSKVPIVAISEGVSFPAGLETDASYEDLTDVSPEA